MRRRQHEDVRELLELHNQQRHEELVRAAVIDCLVDLLDPTNEYEEREWFRYELSVLRQMERRAQRINRTTLVLRSSTYDADAGDELAELTDYDVDRLRWRGVTFPTTACEIEALESDAYARRAFCEGF